MLTQWNLDEFGYAIPGSDTPHQWTVPQTGITAFGDTGVTMVLDSSGKKTGDTLLFRFASGGNVYEFGFFSRVTARMGAGATPPHWDLVAASGLSPGTNWVAGVSDSMGTDTVYGAFVTFNPQTDYIPATVNGVSTVFPVYHVDFTSQRILCSLLLTDSPTCFAVLREESTSSGNGFEIDLNSLTHH